MLIRARVHPFPSRTRKLSSLLLTILGWRRPGKIGSANTKPLRRKSRGFCHVTESHEGYGEAQGSSGESRGVVGGVIRGEQSCFGRLPGEVWKNQRKIMTAYRLGFLENMSVIRKKFFSKYGGYGILTTIGISAGRPRSAAVFSAENGNADGGRTKEGCERAWANCCVWSISASGSEISMPTRTSA